MRRVACLLALLTATDVLAQAPTCDAPDVVDAQAAAQTFRSLASTSARSRQQALDALGPDRTLRVGGLVEARYDTEQGRLHFGTNGAPSPADVTIPTRLRDRRRAGAPEPVESLFGVPLPADSLVLAPTPSFQIGRLRTRLLDLDGKGTACVFHVYSIEGDTRLTARLDRIELVSAGFGEPIVWSWAFPVRADGAGRTGTIDVTVTTER